MPRVSSWSLSSAPCPGLATEHFTVLALVRFYSVEFGLRLRPLCGLHDDSAHEGSFYRMDFVYGAPEPVALFYRLDIVYGALQPMTSPPLHVPDLDDQCHHLLLRVRSELPPKFQVVMR